MTALLESRHSTSFPPRVEPENAVKLGYDSAGPKAPALQARETTLQLPSVRQLDSLRYAGRHGELHAGFALRDFREPSGVLDTERPGTKFEDWEGHKLDRPLLALLQKKRKA